MSEERQSWTEAVIECVSDKQERERLIRMYEPEELIQACLMLGTLVLSLKQERASLRSRLEAAEKDAEDAEMFRWIRDHAVSTGHGSGLMSPEVEYFEITVPDYSANFTAAVKSAIAADKERK